MATTGINVGNHDRREPSPALIGSLKTQAITGQTRVRADGDGPVFVVSDGDVAFELDHDLGAPERAAVACEGLASALLAHAALIRRRSGGTPRRAAYVFPPSVDQQG